MKRPVVLALNPSIDAEWQVDAVRWEEKNNVLAERRWAGGKGVNVARWLRHLGENPLLILPLGGRSGSELAAALSKEHLAARVVPIREATRVNIIVTTPKQGQMRFNPLGPKLSRAEWQAMLQVVRVALEQASALVLSGSLPRGVSVSAYARLLRLASRAGVPVMLDCDGPALRAAAPAHPLLVKPNEHELCEWAASAGLRVTASEVSLRRAANELSRVTRGWVLVSRGARPALLINATLKVQWSALPPKCRPRHTIGAGDALLAAVTQQVIHGATPGEWLKAGLATGSTATQCEAGQVTLASR